MKKVALFSAAAGLSLAAFAGANDKLISFCTKGPDTYADGGVVEVGECYALVWRPSGTEEPFAVLADGTTAGGEIVAVYGTGTRGRCWPNCMFRVDEEDVKAKYADGTGSWSVYLLDTRRWADGAAPVPAGAAGNSRPRLVNASVKVMDAGTDKLVCKVAQCASTPSAVPADAPDAKIESVRFADGKFVVTVGNTASYLQYGLKAGETPQAVETEVADSKRTGAEAEGGKITLVAPAPSGEAPGRQFFKLTTPGRD